MHVTGTRFHDADFLDLPCYYRVTAYNAAGEQSSTPDLLAISPGPTPVDILAASPRPISDNAFAGGMVCLGRRRWSSGSRDEPDELRLGGFDHEFRILAGSHRNEPCDKHDLLLSRYFDGSQQLRRDLLEHIYDTAIYRISANFRADPAAKRILR